MKNKKNHPNLISTDRATNAISLATGSPIHLLVNAGISLSEIDDFNQLVESITTIALEMGMCEGCSVYRSDGKSLHFLASRNKVLEARGVERKHISFQIPIDDKTIAGYVAHSKKVLNIEDAYKLPEGATYNYNPAFDKMNNYRCCSLLTIPMCDTKGKVLGVLQLINHVENNRVVPFPATLEPFLRALSSQIGVVMRNVTMAEDVKRSRIETVKKFVKASEYRDGDTGSHIERMSAYSALLCAKLGYAQPMVDTMKIASMLHDIGKISIPDAILKKPAKLDAEERRVMDLHTVYGYEMLVDSDSPFLQMGALIALTHHEKWDGSGYPRQLKGEDIPIEGRIVALADVFDALCSRRVYKKEWPLEEVFSLIRKDSGKHFDPLIVEVFFAHIDEVLAIRASFPDALPETEKKLLPNAS